MDNSTFDYLYRSENFTSSLGKLVMASAKFETSIKRYIDNKGKVQYGEKSTLGKLLKLLVQNHTIDRTAVEHFGMLLHERNYFVHNLHLNLSEYPLNEQEALRFINRANGVANDMDFFSSLLFKYADNNL